MNNVNCLAKIEKVVFLLVTLSAFTFFMQKSYAQEQELSLEEAVAKYFPAQQINPQKKKLPKSNQQEKSIQKLVSSSETTSSELSKEVQQLKSKVLQLNRELFILEEDLLFPASTQVAVFVSLDIGRFFKLDSVEVKINEQDVAGFLYTDRQRIALEQGGIQKLYLGNLKAGSHQLTAIFVGLDNEGRSIKRAINHSFDKSEESVMIELKLVDNTLNYRTQVEVEEWVL